MIEQIQYIASWSRYKLQKRLGERGAEMVEYAIVLACIAAVAVYFYMRESGTIFERPQGSTQDHGGANSVMFEIMKKFAKIIQGL